MDSTNLQPEAQEYQRWTLLLLQDPSRNGAAALSPVLFQFHQGGGWLDSEGGA